jgi:dipeptidyl aminopeptidase/acylaminoacyl peptidase
VVRVRAIQSSSLVEYTVRPKGKPRLTLQGILHYPANYDPARRYPMVVYLYEKLSDNLHRFQSPSERDDYNGASLTRNGSFFFQPDIVLRPREPGVSMLECVAAAVKTITDMGVVHPARVGVMGHSWGGFDATYLATHSTIVPAAVAGAGISNLVSYYGNHHWFGHYLKTEPAETWMTEG